MTRVSPPTATTPIQRQAQDLLDSSSDISPRDLAAELDFGIRPETDLYPSWHPAPKPRTPMVRAIFLWKYNDWNDREITDALEADPELAAELGFTEESRPKDRSVFYKAWNRRFDEAFCTSLKRDIEWVQQYARSIEHSISTPILNAADTRTEGQLLTDKLQTVPKEAVQLIADDLHYLPDRATNTQYHQNVFIELESVLGVFRAAANDGSTLYGDNTHRKSGAPDGSTHLHYIKQLATDDILAMFNTANATIVDVVKQEVSLLRPVDVAIDITYVGYYGDERGGFVLGAPPKRKYQWCHQFATLSIVGENTKFVLAVQPVQKETRRGELVKDLLPTAQQLVPIRTVYADSEFAAVEVLQTMERQNVEYIIPVRKEKRVKREIARMQHDVKVKQGYGMYGRTARRTNDRVTTNLVLLPSTEDETKTVGFFTNKDVTDETPRDRMAVRHIIDKYRYRWGTETNFRSKKTFLPYTSSNKHRIRVFHFVFACLLFNVWRIIDFLVQLTVAEHGVEPTIAPKISGKRAVNAVVAHELLLE